jgi:hypothetical protein
LVKKDTNNTEKMPKVEAGHDERHFHDSSPDLGADESGPFFSHHILIL